MQHYWLNSGARLGMIGRWLFHMYRHCSYGELQLVSPLFVFDAPCTL